MMIPLGIRLVGSAPAAAADAGSAGIGGECTSAEP
jgi:hypothetical protein